MWIWILLIVLVLLILWFVSAQRRLVSLDELCGNALSQIGVQLQSRWDALTALVQLTKNYAAHESETLMETVRARQQPITRESSAAQVEEQEDVITQVLRQIVAVAEAYPDLKADQMYARAMEGVNAYENNVRHSRMVYNDTVTKWNRAIRQIPTNLVAGMLGFQVREYLQDDPGKSQMPSMS